MPQPRVFGQRRSRPLRVECDRLRRHADRRLSALVDRANARSRPRAPKLTLEVARTIARDLVGSALARAQERHGVKVYGFVAMSNHFHMRCQTDENG